MAYDNAIARGFQASAANHSGTSHTIGSGGNRIVYVAVFWDASGSTVNEAKWGGAGGASMTQVGTTQTWGGSKKAALFVKKMPDTGAAAPYFSWSGGNTDVWAILSVSYDSVDQSTSNRAVTFFEAASASAFSNPWHTWNYNVTSEAGDVVVGMNLGRMVNPADSCTIVVNGGETSRAEIEDSTNDTAANIVEETAAGTTTNIDVRVDHGPSDSYYMDQASFGFALIAGAAASTAPISTMSPNFFGFTPGFGR